MKKPVLKEKREVRIYNGRGNNYGKPLLMLQGNWLQELGFFVGRMLYQMEGFELEGVIRDLRASAMYAPKLEQRKTAESVIRKLRTMPEDESWRLVMDIRRNYHVPGGAKTIGENMLQRDGAGGGPAEGGICQHRGRTGGMDEGA